MPPRKKILGIKSATRVPSSCRFLLQPRKMLNHSFPWNQSARQNFPRLSPVKGTRSATTASFVAGSVSTTPSESVSSKLTLSAASVGTRHCAKQEAEAGKSIITCDRRAVHLLFRHYAIHVAACMRALCRTT